MFLSFLFTSCQKEELFDNNSINDDSNLSIKTLNYQDVNNNESLLQEINNITISSNNKISLGKNSNTYFNLQDYDIITSHAKKIISEEKTSYTFSLKNKDGSFQSSKLFNIVFITKSNEEKYTKLITVYHLSEEQRNEIENQTTPSSSFIISFHFVDQNDNIYPPLKTNINSVYDGEENGDDGFYDDDNDGLYDVFDPDDGGGSRLEFLDEVIIEVPEDDWTPRYGLPDWGDNEGEAPGADPDLPHPGGSGGYTTPVDSEKDPDNPCDSISEKFDNENLKNALKDLFANINSSIEHGFSENSDGTFSNGINGTEGNIQLQLNENTIGYAHTHPTTPMFSPTDFEVFWQLILKTHHNPNINPSEAYGIVLHKDANYLLNFTGDYEDDWDIFGVSPKGDDMREKYNKIYRETFGDLEKTFISYVEEYMLKDNCQFADFF